MDDKPLFLNVDLDVAGGTLEGLKMLLDHWQGHIVLLDDPTISGEAMARIELLDPQPNAVETIRHFCELVESLPPRLSELWLSCPTRTLNMGYDSGRQRPALIESLPAELLARVAKAFSTLEWTIYPLPTVC